MKEMKNHYKNGMKKRLQDFVSHLILYEANLIIFIHIYFHFNTFFFLKIMFSSENGAEYFHGSPICRKRRLILHPGNPTHDQ